jgi:hypothetical protein
MPVQLTDSAWPIDKRLDDTNFLRAWAIDGVEERHKFIARRLVHLLIRRLRPRTENEDAPPVTIFLSHTKMDLEREPRVVETLLAHLTATQPEKTWFDSGDISTGSRFAHEIDRGVKDSALLAIVTDSYSSRSWCRKEVLFAKHHQRPVVIVDAVQEREARRFPYCGNTPVIRWNAQDAQGVVDLLLREVLRHAYAEESLKKRQGDVVLPAGPKLVTIVHHRKGKDQPVVLYPDPPLGPQELEVLERSGVRVSTRPSSATHLPTIFAAATSWLRCRCRTPRALVVTACEAPTWTRSSSICLVTCSWLGSGWPTAGTAGPRVTRCVSRTFSATR